MTLEWLVASAVHHHSMSMNKWNVLFNRLTQRLMYRIYKESLIVFLLDLYYLLIHFQLSLCTILPYSMANYRSYWNLPWLPTVFPHQFAVRKMCVLRSFVRTCWIFLLPVSQASKSTIFSDRWHVLFIPEVCGSVSYHNISQHDRVRFLSFLLELWMKSLLVRTAIPRRVRWPKLFSASTSRLGRKIAVVFSLETENDSISSQNIHRMSLKPSQ